MNLCKLQSWELCEHWNYDVVILKKRFEDTFTTFEIQTWLPDVILGINPFRIFCAWLVWAEVTYHLGKNKTVSSLSIDRHLNIQITAWLKLGMHTNKAAEDWEKDHKVLRQLFHCSGGVFRFPLLHICEEYPPIISRYELHFIPLMPCSSAVQI